MISNIHDCRLTLSLSCFINLSYSTMTTAHNTDIKWLLTVSGRLRWWYKSDNVVAGRQVKGAVSLEALSDGWFFLIAYDGVLLDSDTMAVIKSVNGRIPLPSCEWKLELRKIKSPNAKGRAIVLSFNHQDPYGFSY